MKNIIIISTLCISAVLSTNLSAQLPPPPPLPVQSDIINKLTAAIQAKDIKKYRDLLADNLMVYNGKKVVSSSKKEWLNIFQEELTKPGVHFDEQKMYQMSGRFFLVENVNTFASWTGNSPADCCSVFYAVTYEVKDEKIVSIIRTEVGDEKIQ